MSFDIERARAQTPGCTERIHFNACGAALMPTPVVDALKQHIDLEARMGGYEAADAAAQQTESTYSAIARMLGCHSNEIAVVENATRGWDMVFYAMPFKRGDRILTCTAEYGSNYIAYLQMARRTGAIIEAIPDDDRGQVDVDALRELIDEHVKLISITHVPTNGGLVNPAAEIGALARQHGIPFLLDACQSAGQMPLDVSELQVDMLSATSRKFLRGPRGMGFVYVREAMIERLEPPFLDNHAATWISRSAFHVREDARRFENWECNVAAKIALGVAVEYALDWGLEAIEARVTALADALRARLDALGGVRVRDRGRRRCGIVSFTVADEAPERVVRALCERGIHASVSRVTSTRLDMQGRGLDALVRAGVHYYNTEEEVERFVAALDDIMRGN